MSEANLYQAAIAALVGAVGLLFGLYRKANEQRIKEVVAANLKVVAANERRAEEAEKANEQLRESNKAMREAIGKLTTSTPRSSRSAKA